MNTIGNIYRLTSFGESHGEAIGGVIDGCPAGVALDIAFIQAELNRRRPGQSALTSSRSEEDAVEILSGLYEGKTLGTSIGFLVRNQGHRSSDYEALKNHYRPSHADFTYQTKYGHRDYRGGGRASARETLARVVAGAIAKQVLQPLGITITAYVTQVGDIVLDTPYPHLDLRKAELNPIRCPDEPIAAQMEALIKRVGEEGDSIGGVVSCVCSGVGAGLGEPVFGKLHAALASAMMGINAAKGFDYGMGFEGVGRRGSEMNDHFLTKVDGSLSFQTNHSGGIQGGISNGEDIYFRVAFKPTPTLLKDHGGRHDPCVLPRAVPVVEAMAALVLLDYQLLHNSRRIE